MLFADVIGQQKTKLQLLEMVAQKRLSHALLFLGKEGSGALPLALAFTEYISLLFSSAKKNSEHSLFGGFSTAEVGRRLQNQCFQKHLMKQMPSCKNKMLKW